MALRNTINFLPEAFRSVTNQRFLGATMDQLVTDAYNIPVNGYIGRKFSPTYKAGDNYVPETTTNRSNYQLEPSVVVKNAKGEVAFTADYLDLLQSVENNGGFNNNHSRLFTSESYNYDGHFDYDKFVNYNNYYWLPDGPASVAVSASDTPTMYDYTVHRDSAVGGYTFSGLGGHANTQLTLVRGGTYTFHINQPGYSFWIQDNPGVSGVNPAIPTLSTRQIFGVTNNGTDNGTVTFDVPLFDAQNFYTGMSLADSVNTAVDFTYTKIQNRLLSDFLAEFPAGLDGVNNSLQNKTFIFIGNQIDDSQWTTPALPAGFVGTDTSNITPGSVIANSVRTNVWKINLVPSGDDYLLQITNTTSIKPIQKVFIGSGNTWASRQFWLDDNYRYIVVPPVTANAEYLYYQDSGNPHFLGEIKLVDNNSVPINVDKDIVGKTSYTSPNGVIFTNGLKVKFDSLVTPATYTGNEYYVEGVGTSIVLVPVAQMTVPDIFVNQIQTTADYLTINRGSQDLNAWSRTNRWFHKDVLYATAKYNQSQVDYGPNIAGRRAIIEFEPNLQLFNNGKQAKANVDIINFDPAMNAFVDIEGQISYTLEGVDLVPGLRIVFAQDYDTSVRGEIYTIDFKTINFQNFIRLLPTADDPVLVGQMLLPTQGNNANKTFRFTGSTWVECQEKTAFNQAPLFDLVDAEGYSFSDSTVYPNSTFAGTKFFSYASGTGNYDTILTNIKLAYQNFNNIGDILFQNNYETDAFTYTENTSTVTKKLSTGYLQRNVGLTDSVKLNDWTKSVRSPGQYQIFTKFYDGYVLPVNGKNSAFVQIDILPKAAGTVPTLKVFLNNALLRNLVDYQLTTYGIYNVITLTATPNVGDKIDVLVFSDDVSPTGYYEIPENLDFNPLNEPFSKITLGQLRNHYNKLIENTSQGPSTPIPVQDRYVKAQGGTLLQQTNPVVYAMSMLTNPSVNFIKGITLARKEYTKFKNKFLTLCSNLSGIDYNNPISGVDAILKNINGVKNISFPWYYSDMVPQGGNYNEITYTVLNARQTHYEINSLFDNTVLSNRAVLVYLNGVQLTLDVDYTFSKTTPAIIFSRALAFNDIILIRDYFDTDGNYIPETPSKLGLYPKFEPAIYVDTTYRTPTTVIRGHDGSITPAFGDFRDNFLLELERRIFNNIKANYSQNVINLYDIIPGRFRTTDYSLAEWNQVITQNFLQWVGSHNINYTTNTWFDANNSWTWNYDQFTDTVDGSYLQGSWRAIYTHWYDTDAPHLTPWVMLGIGAKPSWWTTRYGPAPYTGNNLTLWEDLQAGYIWNGSDSASYIDSRFARPGLLNFIPVDSAGNLRSPIDIGIIKNYNAKNAGNSFKVGEHSPVETAWRRSSDYPFSLQVAVAMTKPAEYFATQIDTSRFYVNTITKQFSNIDNQRVTPGLIVTNGDSVTNPGSVLRSSGYLNWIADSIKNLGVDPVTTLNEYFTNFSTQLTYKVAGFTDQKLIRVSAEQSSPSSTNASVIIPDQNYSVYFGEPVPSAIITYSGVIVTKTETGYSVSGYDTANPFFNIIPSVANNNASVITVGDTSVKIYQTSTNKVSAISYGTTFTSIQQVTDFLVSYQRYLISKGFVFTQFDQDLQAVRDWMLSVQEFVFWAQQGWASGTIIVLNPVFDQLKVAFAGAVVGEITNLLGDSQLLDTNFEPIKNNNFNILRQDSPVFGNQFRVSTVDGRTPIAFAKLNLIQYESILVFDNVDSFGDILYVPSQGTRQYRLKMSGAKTGAWTGSLSAAGYIYSDPKIKDWQTGVDYRQGDIVLYNNNYYTAIADAPASQTFVITLWAPIRKSDIQTGLLPSLGHNAQIFQNIYDVDNPPLDENFQKFSAGLIGFRERPFLSNLGISIPTQTKFYQGYITQKGTANAIDALTKATFDNVTSPVNTYEEWAFRVGTYGDVNSNEFREFVLDQSVFTASPVALTLTTDTYSNSNVIVDLTLSNIYNASNLSSTSTALYHNRPADAVYQNDLTTAGYVHVGDTEYQIFDISTVGSMPMLDIGNKIWVAKDTAREWNVYRVTEVYPTIATTLTYTLDNFAQLTFSDPHSLAVGDYFVLQNFNSNFNGLYQVVSVLNTLNVTINIINTATLIKTNSRISGQGTIYRLDSMVVDSVLDIDNLTPLNNWINGDRVWVNSATNLGWGVYTFNRPWASNSDVKLTANTITAGNKFGTGVRFGGDNNQYFYISSPGNQTVKIFSVADHAANVTLTNTNSYFGNVVESQGTVLAIGSQANVHVYQHNNSITPTKRQTITSANIAQVSSISISQDQHWLFIGDSTNNLFEAYYSANIALVPYKWIATNTSNASTAFGAQIKSDATGNVVIVGAPMASDLSFDSGTVYVYKQSSANVFTKNQTITCHSTAMSANFGTSLDIDSTGGNLFIGAPTATISQSSTGIVERYVYSGGNYTFNQLFTHPLKQSGTFGTSLRVQPNARTVAIGSAGDDTESDTTFDNAKLTIDAGTTHFVEFITGSGSVHVFEPVIDLTSPGVGQFSYVQELIAQVNTGDSFGASVDINNGIILVGAPGANSGAGNAHVFASNSATTAWTLSRQQTPSVDISTINRTFIYNKSNNVILSAIDYIDPAKGKVLNAVGVDIDYQIATDPAIYNAGTGTLHPDFHWGPNQVGKIWWDTSAVRYIDYEQDELIYRLTHWGDTFPGSEILVFEWVESTVPPSRYVASGGNGVPLYINDSAYSTYGYVTQSGNVNLKYYFWVYNKTTTNVVAGKSNSVYSIAEAIKNPQAQGISYANILRNDTIALYNVNQSLSGQSSILHISNNAEKAGLIHSEYALVQEGNPASQLPLAIENKLIDSLAGQDGAGNPVPDPALTPAQAYGINIRPRQSMFINRALAIDNYLTLVNQYLAKYPVVERKLMTTLNSSEAIPPVDSGAYAHTVDTLSALEYLDTAGLSTGYKVLVNSDTSHMSKWVIYAWNTPVAGKWNVSRTQSYKTNLYWNYIDWYQTGYDYTVTPDVTVTNNIEYGKLTLKPNTYIKVLNNGNNQFVVYYVDAALTQNLVGIQNGTVQISAGTIPPLELRQIAKAIQTDILIDDLAAQYNKLFFTMIKYTLSEQKNLEWVFKTSFLSSTQYIRQLQQYVAYTADNQNYYLDYINEIKPYRTVLREFVLDYRGNDTFGGDVTDFDLPSYWDGNVQVYRSPDGTQAYDSSLLTSGVYTQWSNNYAYRVVNIVIENPGSGYILPPQITITGGGGKGATAHAGPVVDGALTTIIIDNPGSGYTSTPTIIITGTGSGAIAYPILDNMYDGDNAGHNVVRSLSTTIKFDRVNYTNANVSFWSNTAVSGNVQYWTTGNTFVFWSNASIGQTISANTIIVNNDQLYVLSNDYTVDSNITFPTANVTAISADAFNNANERIVAYNGNIDLALTQSGIEYPGVTIDGNTFVGDVYDTSIQSFYGNVLGVAPGEIIINGGSYVNSFTSHAPQELVPGYIRESLNLTVYSNNVSDSGANVSYREFQDMSGNLSFYRISAANTTTLTSSLALTDNSIFVADASKLPAPNLVYNRPGVVYINGEKITYWRNYATETKTPWVSSLTLASVGIGNLITYSSNVYITTGNVYDANGTFENISSNVQLVNANTLTQIRRGVDGTYTPSLHLANLRVVDSSYQQFVPSSYVMSSGNGSSKTYTVTANVTTFITVANVITVSTGDYIEQKFANTVVAANLQVIDSAVNSANVAVIVTAGNITQATGNTITLNGFAQVNHVVNFGSIGQVNPAGNVTLPANTMIRTSKIWTSTNSSLDASTTEQATFLNASPGFYVTPGTTP